MFRRSPWAPGRYGLWCRPQVSILHGYMRQVMPFDLPGGLGSDAAGVVDQVGEGVTAFSVGDEVLGAPSPPPTRSPRSPTPPHWSPSRPLSRGRLPRPQGVDVVLDASGRGEIPDSIELAGGPTRVLSLVAFDAVSTGIQIHMTEPGAGGPEALRNILALIEAGRLQVPISGTYPLDEVAAALAVSQSGHPGGNLVVLPA
ncbi:zinc-binding dehydrogenase [Streptomyces shenzhenensis]|uniref:zinc-binding dehydrogenase n=1 Tax=Streptomyces shenzhenensis TaxID=943815 RepID=UPI0036CFA24B